jgi:TolB protein
MWVVPLPPFKPNSKQYNMSFRIVIAVMALILLISYASVMENALKERETATEGDTDVTEQNDTQNPLVLEGEESHLYNIRQLTFGGDNAEAYWSFDNNKLVYQYRDKSKGMDCDQIYWGDTRAEEFTPHMVSNGKGRTTCAYFLPGNERIVYASTFQQVETCLKDPDRSKGYLWGVYPSYEIYVADLDGNIVQQLTNNNYYDAEATVSPKGDKIVFTSDRSGDLELWTMNIDGSGITQITDELGYDGGAFFSPDGSKIIFRASRFETEEEKAEYKRLLSEGFVRPNEMELFVCNADGSDLKQITNLGGANWAPFFHPSGEKIIFSSNHVTKRVPFNLFMVNLDGSGLEQITFDTVFDSFPMFSPDGKKIVFGSNRNNNGTRDTNLFIADWKD